MTYHNITLPKTYARYGFDSETKTMVQALVQKLNQTSVTDEININSVFVQYSSWLLICRKNFTLIAQAEWKEEYYGTPATPLGSSEPKKEIL